MALLFQWGLISSHQGGGLKILKIWNRIRVNSEKYPVYGLRQLYGLFNLIEVSICCTALQYHFCQPRTPYPSDPSTNFSSSTLLSPPSQPTQPKCKCVARNAQSICSRACVPVRLRVYTSVYTTARARCTVHTRFPVDGTTTRKCAADDW